MRKTYIVQFDIDELIELQDTDEFNDAIEQQLQDDGSIEENMVLENIEYCAHKIKNGTILIKVWTDIVTL